MRSSLDFQPSTEYFCAIHEEIICLHYVSSAKISEVKSTISISLAKWQNIDNHIGHEAYV
ncbi:hypothetical protein RINTHH_1440 [Richelia intracellularis HH01]|uniref:Uncharacterized protein n=1 Tax=Richelia intracellularis HH01 TaxID=1165094 RepID=M1WQC4_9NOST|nr:hypothetical protein [Richelia intracellularis]CCH66299.1 hypothetical protein RINTHH_1440 [Richelia intracellularis HH01]